MNKLIIKLAFFLSFLALIVQNAESYPLENNKASANEQEQQIDPVQPALTVDDEVVDAAVTAQIVRTILEKYPALAAKVFEQELTAREQSTSEEHDQSFNRERRRLSVFKNIYNQCRITKRKDKDMCMYLANLYQNVKGFHGL